MGIAIHAAVCKSAVALTTSLWLKSGGDLFVLTANGNVLFALTQCHTKHGGLNMDMAAMVIGTVLVLDMVTDLGILVLGIPARCFPVLCILVTDLVLEQGMVQEQDMEPATAMGLNRFTAKMDTEQPLFGYRSKAWPKGLCS